MRLNLRIKIRNITFFCMLSQTQSMKGLTSLIKNVGRVMDNIHICMWDLEGCHYYEAIATLEHVRVKYGLGKIHLCGESEHMKSFRAWCFTPVTFRTLLKIILDTDYIDYLFYKYTVIRGKATLRTSQKENRPPQRILVELGEGDESIPRIMQMVEYDTGLVKSGHTFELIKE